MPCASLDRPHRAARAGDDRSASPSGGAVARVSSQTLPFGWPRAAHRARSHVPAQSGGTSVDSAPHPHPPPGGRRAATAARRPTYEGRHGGAGARRSRRRRSPGDGRGARPSRGERGPCGGDRAWLRRRRASMPGAVLRGPRRAGRGSELPPAAPAGRRGRRSARGRLHAAGAARGRAAPRPRLCGRGAGARRRGRRARASVTCAGPTCWRGRVSRVARPTCWHCCSRGARTPR